MKSQKSETYMEGEKEKQNAWGRRTGGEESGNQQAVTMPAPRHGAGECVQCTLGKSLTDEKSMSLQTLSKLEGN